MDLLHAIESAGLSEGEAQVYHYLLQSAEATIYDIARETQVPRTTAYRYVDSLIQKRLVHSTKRNNVTYCTPVAPKKLLDNLKAREEILADALPDLYALLKTDTTKPKVKLFIGKDGMKDVWEDILETAKREKIKTLYATTHPNMMNYLPKYFPVWQKRRVALGINTLLIIPGREHDNIPENYRSYNNRETRFFPNAYPFQCSMNIYGSKLAFFTLKNEEIHSVIVSSPIIAEMFRQFFLFAWNTIGPSA